MRNDDERIAQLLRDVAADMPTDPELERRTLRRSRRRRALNASLAGAAAVVVVTGTWVGLRALTAVPPPSQPALTPSPTGSPHPSASQVAEPPGTMPIAVQETWLAIRTAVEDRDVDALEELIDPMTFAYNFSDGSNPIPEWRDDPSALEPIPQILDMPYYVTPGLEAPDGFVGEFYQWPYLMEPGSLDEVTNEERADLHALGFDDADIQGMRDSGAYLGPRLVIRADGLWTAYVTGGD
jgi:hypothetical protein